tara:strand:+ start:2338 stop:4827 length:2490 start_codon:yes stop_codon:yes gene_type:complete
MKQDYFQKASKSLPKIYAFSLDHNDYKGLLKIGFTTKEVKTRVEKQFPTLDTQKPIYKIHLDESAMKNDGSVISDHQVRNYLVKKGFIKPFKNKEFIKCNVIDVKNAINVLTKGIHLPDGRNKDFDLRPDQIKAIEKTKDYFNSLVEDKEVQRKRFLWNAKMRFGKTFTAYKLALEMKWKKLLIITYKPAVESSWEEDIKSHKDFVGWQFLSKNNKEIELPDENQPFVWFGSFQDVLGKNAQGEIKRKNEWLHSTDWDCVIIDEYHYGAWRNNAKDLFDSEDKKEINAQYGKSLEEIDEATLPISAKHYLYLSGTPFRAIATGEFIEEQIYNWTYSDEQNAKARWKGEDNPYLSLPRMILMTYQLPDSIREIAMKGEYDEFDLNTFFSAKGEGRKARFIYENEVQKWLDLIRGQNIENVEKNLKLGYKKPPYPFSDSRLFSLLSHTLWYLPSIASCYAMHNLIFETQNSFFHDFNIVIAAGSEAGLGVKALLPVHRAMINPLRDKSITLSCGKLMTGVSVKPWSGIFMLRNLSSPESYFQAAFRVQTPWEIYNPDGLSPNEKEIIKKDCYVFDFAPQRALRQIADYSCRLNINESNPEKKVEEFIQFLPVLAFDGSAMEPVDAGGILDLALSGTSATLLARRWKSALLVNVDNATLLRLMNNEKAMEALMNIEGFRNLNEDLEIIINQSKSISATKSKQNKEKLTSKEKKQLTEEEKKQRNLRKEVREKLLQFATRIPIFMYLTDFRETSLKDVITKLEPDLFKKVTGVSKKDFELLLNLNLFNSSLMNDAIYKFKRYEDASLKYTGITSNNFDKIGLFDTVIQTSEYI